MTRASRGFLILLVLVGCRNGESGQAGAPIQGEPSDEGSATPASRDGAPTSADAAAPSPTTPAAKAPLDAAVPDDPRTAQGGVPPCPPNAERVHVKSGAWDVHRCSLDGKNVGVMVSLWPNGLRRSYKPFKDGVQHGTAYSFREDGSLEKEMPYSEGKPTGTWFEYNSKGEVHGDVTTWSAQGKIDKSERYENGHVVSEPMATCPKGTSKKELSNQDLSDEWQRALRHRITCERPDGTPHGPFRELYGGRQLEREGAYKNGKLDGEVLWYTDTGEKTHQAFWKKGIPTGTWKHWYLGQLKAEITFWPNGRQKVVKYYQAPGVLQHLTRYDDKGNRLAREEYDQSGKMLYDDGPQKAKPDKKQRNWATW